MSTCRNQYPSPENIVDSKGCVFVEQHKSSHFILLTGIVISQQSGHPLAQRVYFTRFAEMIAKGLMMYQKVSGSSRVVWLGMGSISGHGCPILERRPDQGASWWMCYGARQPRRHSWALCLDNGFPKCRAEITGAWGGCYAKLAVTQQQASDMWLQINPYVRIV